MVRPLQDVHLWGERSSAEVNGRKTACALLYLKAPRIESGCGSTSHVPEAFYLLVLYFYQVLKPATLFGRSVLFSGTFRTDILEGPGSLAVCFMQQALRSHLCWSIPTLPILRYMISSAPGGRILDVAAGSGYWSALLAGLGADVEAIDDFSWWKERRGKDAFSTKSADRDGRPLQVRIL